MKKNLRKQDSLMGIKARQTFKLKIFGFAVLAFIVVLCFVVFPIATTSVVMAVAPFAIPVGGKIKSDTDMDQTEKDFMATFATKMNEAFAEFQTKGNDPEILQKALKELLKGATEEQKKKFDDYDVIIKELAQKVSGFETKGLDMGENESQIQKAVKEVLDSEKFKSFAKGNTQKSSGVIKISTKALSLGSSYSGGTAGISVVANRVSENPQPRKLSMRDCMMTESSEEPFLVYQQITDLDRNAAAVSENGVLPESSFKVKEITAGATRIGTTIFVSKRMLRSIKWLQSWLSNRIPAMVRLAEDFQILKGDGAGSNLLGIFKVCQNAKTVLSTLITGVAGSIATVETYNGGLQTLVTFTGPQSLINNGADITFAAFANAAYNAKFKANKVNDRQIVIDVAYTVQTAPQIAAATFSAGGEFAETVVAPTIADAILAVQAYLTYGEYSPNCLCLNPIDTFKLRVLKDTQDRYLDVIKFINGVYYIGNMPICETTAVVPGEFFIGDCAMGASLVDFQSLELEFAEDITSKRANQVAIIVQEEVIFPVYNPYAFLYGKFSEVITLITAV